MGDPGPLRLFPYTPRPGQAVFAGRAAAAVEGRGHLLVEAGTGSGKTVTALSAALERALAHDLRVLYVTRTNAQQRQALLEFRALRGRTGLAPLPLAVGQQGRANFCPQLRSDPRFGGATAEELGKLCADAKRRTLEARQEPGRRPDARTCAWYHGLLDADPDDVAAFARDAAPTPDEFAADLERRGLCPYEAVKSLLPDARLVVAPYAYVFDPRLRRGLLDRMGTTADRVVLVVDEAHNLPEWAREAMSGRLTRDALARAVAEAGDLGHPSLGPWTTKEFLAAVQEGMDAVAAEFLDGHGAGDGGAGRDDPYAAPSRTRVRGDEEDALVPPSALETELMSRLRCTSLAVGRAAEGLVALGVAVQDAKRRRGELPRSHLHALGGFLLAWTDATESEHAKLVTRVRDAPALELYALDPGLATRACLDFAATVHMSGTLRPLDQYRDALGLPRTTDLLQLPSPFPAEHLEVLVAEDVTTRYESLQRDASMAARLHDHVVRAVRATRRNTAVFFPSYAMLRSALDEGLRAELGRRVLVDERDLDRGELAALLAAFRESARDGGAVLLSVMGGRVSEGIDFPAEELEVAVLVGLPYARPSAKQRALVSHNDLRFGRGWAYAVEAPMLRKVLQSLGRLLRSPTDRALAVLLDQRALAFAGRLPAFRSLGGDALADAVGAWDRATPPAQRAARTGTV